MDRYIEDIVFPVPACIDDQPHPKHRIEGTWREQCRGVEGPEASHDSALRYLDQWIAEKLVGLSEADLHRLKAKLDEVAAGKA